MCNMDLRHLLHTWTDETALPQPFPTTDSARCHLLEQIRDGVLDLLDAGDIATAEQAVRLAWTLARHTDHPEQQALAHWSTGLLLLNRETHPALTHLEAAHAFYQTAGRQPEQGRILIGCAGLLGQLGRLDEARTTLTMAEDYLAAAPAYQNRRTALLLNRSDIEGRMGQYAAMLTSARAAEALAVQYAQPAARIEALINQAVAALFLGMFTDATAILQQAATAAQTVGSAELRARVAVNQARLATYRGELFPALKLLQQAQTDFATAQIELDQATVAVEAASLYERLQLPHEAHQSAGQAAGIFAQAQLANESLEAALTALRLALRLNQRTTARRDLALAQEYAAQFSVAPVFQWLLTGYAAHPLFQRTADARHAALQQATAASAQLDAAELITEHLQVALIAADLAVLVRQPDAAERYQAIMTRAQQHALPLLEQQAAEGLAGTLRAKAACEPLQRAVDLAARVQRSLPLEEFKAGYLSGLAPLYGRLITAYLTAKQPDAALRVLLQAKGSLWIELAEPAEASTTSALIAAPDWVRAKTSLHYWQEQQQIENGPDHQALCAEHIRQAQAELTTLARRQTRVRPVPAVPDLAQIQCHLPPQSGVLEYLVTPDRIRACLLLPDSPPRWMDLGKRKPVEASLGKLALLRRALQRLADPEQQRQHAHAQHATIDQVLTDLYVLLLAPIMAVLPDTVTRLLIAPNDLLFGLPWTALRNNAAPDTPYLGQQYELSILPSAAVLALPLPPTSIGTARALGAAGSGVGYLTQVAPELAAVQRWFPDIRCSNPAYLDALNWERPPNILHLAMHGEINATAPLLSRLVLADGSLLLADVLNLPLYGTRLVTLSACDTATTPERGGVALALAGAFLTAGAQAVIASLWQVDDQATGRLMDQFYAGLAQGLRIPQALQQAQAHVRAAGDTHPYYWAAFQPLLRGWPEALASTLP